MTDFSISRGETSTLIQALGGYKRECLRKLKQAQKRKKYIPGVAASYAMEAAETDQLSNRLLEYAVANGWMTTMEEVKR